MLLLANISKLYLIYFNFSMILLFLYQGIFRLKYLSSKGKEKKN